MSISTRISISWPPTISPTETTDTLVLSFPNDYFIDLRPLKSYESLDWGMAGYQISSQTPKGTKSTSLIYSIDTVQFIHLVDSRNPLDPKSVKDEGLFKKLDNGDELETGTMMNHNTGRLMNYEEIWQRLPSTIAADKVVLLESCGDKDKTFLGRIGKWFQGIGTTDGKVNAVRAELVNETWKTVLCVGQAERVPCISEDEWKVGDEIQIQGRKWRVLVCKM
jgi:hypothetical protein